MFHFFWSRHAFLVEPPHLQPPRPILPLSLSLFSFSLQFSPLVAANISPLGLVLARQPLAAIEAAMMGRQRSRKQRRSQLRSSSLIDLVRVFFSIFGRCCRVTCEGGSLSFIIFFWLSRPNVVFFQSRIIEIGLASLQRKKTRKRSSVVEKNTGEWMEKSARPERGTVTLIESRSHVWLFIAAVFHWGFWDSRNRRLICRKYLKRRYHKTYFQPPQVSFRFPQVIESPAC